MSLDHNHSPITVLYKCICEPAAGTFEECVPTGLHSPSLSNSSLNVSLVHTAEEHQAANHALTSQEHQSDLLTHSNPSLATSKEVSDQPHQAASLSNLSMTADEEEEGSANLSLTPSEEGIGSADFSQFPSPGGYLQQTSLSEVAARLAASLSGVLDSVSETLSVTAV